MQGDERGHLAEAAPRAHAHRPSDMPALRLPVLARLAGLALCVALGACQTDGSGTASAGGRTLAFDTIDGPPPQTFDKLVGQLSSEAEQRRMAVVSRSTNAAYRVKGYLALHVEKGTASVAYAWDVYDQSQTRVARVTGEEQAGRVKGNVSNAWAACDDAVLSRVADKSMASLAETLGIAGTSASAPAAAPPAERSEPSGVPVAALSAPSAALAYANN